MGSLLLENYPTGRPRPRDGGGRVLGKVSRVTTVFSRCSLQLKALYYVTKGCLHSTGDISQGSLLACPPTSDTPGSPALHFPTPALTPKLKRMF